VKNHFKNWVHTVLDQLTVKNIRTVLVLNIIVVTTLVGNGRHYAIQSRRYVGAIKHVENSDYPYNDVTEWNPVDT
jgi:hypothetical protein